MSHRPGHTFQYSNSSQITPEIIAANPGGFPAQIGQTLNLPPQPLTGLSSTRLGEIFREFFPLGTGRNVTQTGFGNPYVAKNAGRNVVGGGFYDILAAKNPGRNVVGGAYTVPPKQPVAPVSQASPYAQQGAYVGGGVYLPSNVPTYAQSQGHPDPGLIQRLANASPEQFAAEVAAMSPTQRDAIERLTQQANGGGTVTNAAGTGSAEFMNTGFMQQNAANNTPFEKQLRWDEDRKKYVQIGKLIAEGKLDNRTGKMRRVQTRRGNSSPARTNSQGSLIGTGVINFNVSSG